MTRNEWLDLVSEMALRWPQADLPEATVAVWFSDVQHLDATVARAAMVSLARDGREWPPTGGMIAARAAELGVSAAPVAGEAWELLQAAVRRFGGMREAEALAWLGEQSPAVAVAVRRFGFAAYCRSEQPAGVARSQFTAVYREVLEGVKREARYRGLPMPRGEQPRLVGAAARRLTAGEMTGGAGEDGAIA